MIILLMFIVIVVVNFICMILSMNKCFGDYSYVSPVTIIFNLLILVIVMYFWSINM